MSNYNAYINYFRALATLHNIIKHNPGSETGDAPVESKRFSTWNAEDVVRNDLRTRMSFSPAALLLEVYQTDLQAQNAYDIKQLPKGAFTVLCKDDLRTAASAEAAMSLAEEIMYDLLQRIWQDHHGPDATLCNTPFRRFHFDKIEIIAVGPLYDNCYGFRCEFAFEFQQVRSIITGPPAGRFSEASLLGGDGFILADSDETPGS